MKAGIRFASSLLVVLSLLAVSVQPALADPLDIVTLSVSGGVYSVTFSGADAGYSFQVDTSSMMSFTTGGGWIPGNAGGKAIFGFVAFPNGGHLVLIDHSTGQAVHGTIAHAFAECLSGQAQFDGTDDNGFGFQVNAGDIGEPGAGRDTFTITGAYFNFNTLLGGGDIQVHGPTCH